MVKPNRTVRSPRSYDRESAKPRVTNSKFNKSQEEDSDVNVSSQSDSELEDELDMPVKDDSRRKQFKQKQSRKADTKVTARQNASHETKETEAPESSISSAPHMIMRSAVYHMKIAPITFPTSSTYIPSFYMYYEMLHSAHKCILDNTYLAYVAPDYITVASSLYYGFIGIIQILRAKSAAGIASRPENQCLRKFEREFPFEQLPVMSPMIMALQNLGAVKLPDPMYSYICPTLPTKLGTAANEEGIFDSDTSMCLPNVPALIRFVYELGLATTINDVTDTNIDRIVPASFTAGNTSFFGINFAQGSRNTASYRRLVYSAGILEPPEIASNLTITALKRIGRWQLPNLTSGTDLQTIGQFLQTDGNLEWFSNLVTMASTEAKFFKGSTNLLKIAPTTGLSSLVETKYIRTAAPEAVDSFYPLSQSQFRNNIFKFQSYSTRGETTPEEFQVGSTSQFLITNFGSFTPRNHNGPVSTTNGPYFDATLQGRQVLQVESDESRSPNYTFESLIKRELLEHTGHQAQ